MKNLAVLLLLSFLVLSIVELAQIGMVKANFEQAPTIAPGSIVINVDGTVNPSTAPIERSGYSYKLTGDIVDQQVYIEQNGITFDGNDHRLIDDKSDYNFGVILNCTKNVTIKNIQINGFYFGIKIQFQTWDPSVGPWGPQPKPDASWVPSNNKISGCTIINCRKAGIELNDASDIIVSQNTITNNNIGVEIAPDWSIIPVAGDQITSNTLKSNGQGIVLTDCDSCIISDNIITRNQQEGIQIGSSNNGVSGNSITENGMGIVVAGSRGAGVQPITNNQISGNQIADNSGWGLRLTGIQTGNKIWGNNIIDNNPSVGFQVSMPQVMVTTNINHNVTVSMISGMANAWSSNNQGNYWSDFKTRYPNATATNNVWDTAFYINENNIDHYSLVSPLANPTLSASYAGMISLASPTAPSTIPMPNLPQLSPTQTAISANKNITIIAIVAITLTVAIIVLTFSIRKNMSHCKEPA